MDLQSIPINRSGIDPEIILIHFDKIYQGVLTQKKFFKVKNKEDKINYRFISFL